jgi:hypothetical protein
MNLEQTDNIDIRYIDSDIHGTTKKLKINCSNTEYCEMTAITKKLSLFDEIFSFFSGYEHDIGHADNIILEFNSDKSNNDSELCEIKKSNINSSELCEMENSDIEYNYYSYGCCPEIPKSILFDRYYLSYVEPNYNSEKGIYELKTLDKLFNSYLKQKSIKLFPSKYNSIYYNIHSDTILFGICKIQYGGKNSSRFVIAYDKTILDKNMIKTIIKDIFIDKKNTETK